MPRPCRASCRSRPPDLSARRSLWRVACRPAPNGAAAWRGRVAQRADLAAGRRPTACGSRPDCRRSSEAQEDRLPTVPPSPRPAARAAPGAVPCPRPAGIVPDQGPACVKSRRDSTSGTGPSPPWRPTPSQRLRGCTTRSRRASRRGATHRSTVCSRPDRHAMRRQARGTGGVEQVAGRHVCAFADAVGWRRARSAGPRGVQRALERPALDEPARHRGVQRAIQLGDVSANPRADLRIVPPSLAG